MTPSALIMMAAPNRDAAVAAVPPSAASTSAAAMKAGRFGSASAIRSGWRDDPHAAEEVDDEVAADAGTSRRAL